MTPGYTGVTVRMLRDTERRVRTDEPETPLVIEPSSSSNATFLQEFLGNHSSQLVRDLSTYGALLLRGFEVESSHEFEQYVLSIQGMQGISEVLFSEPGRTIADNTNFVFHTNALVKTGGTLQFGMFHTENYVVPDVPRYVSFWCQTPGTLGGETGLVNMAKLYADLPTHLKVKLEERACLVSLYPIREMAFRYAVDEGTIDAFCSITNLPAVSINGTRYVAIYKPSVVEHPLTLERSLLINFAYIPSVQKPVVQAFLGDYGDYRWLPHRLFWRADRMAKVIARVTNSRRVYQPRAIYVTQTSTPVSEARSLSSVFSPEDAHALGGLVRRRYSSFTWRRGDILIIDNLKMAHNGMAGYGKRDLKVMMCNRIPLPLSATESGMCPASRLGAVPESLGAQLKQLSEARDHVIEVARSKFLRPD